MEAQGADDSELPFWQIRPLSELSRNEWESLCDGCGKCCLIKLVDDVTDDLHYTSVACRLLDCNTCRCGNYPERQSIVEDCLALSPELVETLPWMPSTCAYRLLHEGKPLLWWHPLVSGSRETVHQAGISVRGRVIPEDIVPDEALIDYIVDWPE